MKAKTLERKESQDQQTLQEAETALSALNKYMTENNLPEDDNGFRAALEKTNMYKDFMTQTKGKIKGVSPHKNGAGEAPLSGAAARLNSLSSVTPTISVADVKRLKEEAKARVAAGSRAHWCAGMDREDQSQHRHRTGC